MKDVSTGNFGLLIAFVLPGFIVLWGASYFSATVRLWLSTADATPTVGGFMFGTLASVAAGVTVSTVRWLVIDKIRDWTGIRQPPWNFSRLGQKCRRVQCAQRYSLQVLSVPREWTDRSIFCVRSQADA